MHAIACAVGRWQASVRYTVGCLQKYIHGCTHFTAANDLANAHQGSKLATVKLALHMI